MAKIDAPQPPKHFPNLDPRKDISTSPLVSTATDLLLQLCDQMHIAYGFTAFTMTKVVELNETDVPSFCIKTHSNMYKIISCMVTSVVMVMEFLSGAGEIQ